MAPGPLPIGASTKLQNKNLVFFFFFYKKIVVIAQTDRVLDIERP